MYDQYSFTVVHSGVEYTPPGENLFVCKCVCDGVFVCVHVLLHSCAFRGGVHTTGREPVCVQMCV